MTASQTTQPVARSPFADLRLAPKLVLAFLFVITVPMASYALVSFPQIRTALLDQGTINLVAGSQSTAALLDQYFEFERDEVVKFSRLPEFAEYLSNPTNSNLKTAATVSLIAIATREGGTNSFGLVNLQGKILISSYLPDEGEDITSRPYFAPALNGETFISNPSISTITGEPSIYISTPIRDTSGKLVGILRQREDLETIWSLVERDRNSAGPGTQGLLLDDNGIRIATSLSLGNRGEIVDELLFKAIAPIPPDVEKRLVGEKFLGAANIAAIPILPLPGIADALVTPGIKSFQTGADESTERHFAAISSLTTKPWRYVLLTPLANYTATADNLLFLFLLIFIIITAVAIIIALFIARQITNPITQLTNVADRISLGELDATIDINRKDEIGELAEAISRMQASLQAAIERLRARRANPS